MGIKIQSPRQPWEQLPP